MIKITPDPLKAEELIATVCDTTHGGQPLFMGTVRNENEGRAVSGVTYEAFAPLAEKILSEIAKTAARRHNAKVAAAHRLGQLKVGEVSVIVCASSPHRAEAFAACREIIEEIKRRLPVWKKEHYAQGSSAWLKGCSLTHEANGA